MLISIRQKLKIDFSVPQQRVLLHLLLTPQDGPSQQVVDWSVVLSPEAHEVPLVDGFGNKALFASLTTLDEPLEIAVSGTVETLGGNGVLGWPVNEPVPWLYHRVTPTTRVPVSVWGKFRGEASQPDSQLNAMHGLMERIRGMLDARAEAEDQPAASQSQSQSQSAGSGAQSQSQDEAEPAPDPAVGYAATFVGSARALGIPARFVSGYYLASDDDKVESGVHAWAEVYIEGLGWVAFDPRLDLCPTDRHIRVAAGLDALTAVPVRACPPVGDDAIPVETIEISVAEQSAQ